MSLALRVVWPLHRSDRKGACLARHRRRTVAALLRPARRPVHVSRNFAQDGHQTRSEFLIRLDVAVSANPRAGWRLRAGTPSRPTFVEMQAAAVSMLRATVVSRTGGRRLAPASEAPGGGDGRGPC